MPELLLCGEETRLHSHIVLGLDFEPSSSVASAMWSSLAVSLRAVGVAVYSTTDSSHLVEWPKHGECVLTFSGMCSGLGQR